MKYKLAAGIYLGHGNDKPMIRFAEVDDYANNYCITNFVYNTESNELQEYETIHMQLSRPGKLQIGTILSPRGPLTSTAYEIFKPVNNKPRTDNDHVWISDYSYVLVDTYEFLDGCDIQDWVKNKSEFYDVDIINPSGQLNKDAVYRVVSYELYYKLTALDGTVKYVKDLKILK